jgi:hypothetical protein
LLAVAATLSLWSVGYAASNDPGTDSAGVGASTPAFGSIEPLVTMSGHLTLSVDGVAENSGSGAIRVQKPSGATVRKAYMAAASTGLSNYQLKDTDVTINGTPVTWALTTASSTQSFNSWADVTSIVKPSVDAAPAGILDVTVGEQQPLLTEGEILAVIFDDPNQTKTNGVVLLFGAQDVTGDTFKVHYASPLDKSDPNLAIDMSLGISFSFQAPGQGNQFSTVDVNGQRLTSSAGGQDDAVALGNGELLTVGGIGDSNENPLPDVKPDCPTAPRCDDELYNLLPFVHSGDTATTVFTQNPSHDDNIFFAAFFMRDVAASVGEAIQLAPVASTSTVGGNVAVTATVLDGNGLPLAGRAVTFKVESGPNAGQSSTQSTNSSGLATFTYSSSAVGSDTIDASFVDSGGVTQTSNTVIVQWTGPTNQPPSVSAVAGATIDEGSIYSAAGSWTDPGSTSWTGTVDYGDSLGGAQSLALDQTNKTFALSHRYLDNGTFTVTVTVTDELGATGTATATVHVTNVPPTPSITGAPTSVPEGSTVSLGSSVSDPSPVDTAAGFTLAWSVTRDGVAFGSPGSGSSFSFTPDDNGTYVVTLSATDKDGGKGVDQATISVSNVPPVVTKLELSSSSIKENDTVTLSGTFTDPGVLDSHTVTINWGPGESSTTLNLAPNVLTFSASHQYLDDNPTGTPSDVYAIGVTVVDKDGGSGSGTASLTVNNVPPVAAITSPTAGTVLTVNKPVTFKGTFTDVGTRDTHTAQWRFNDLTTPGQVTESDGSGSVSATFTFTDAGIYNVSLAVTDDDTGVGTASTVGGKPATVIVVNPGDGFVTGGGWIRSADGAKSNFGFVAKYLKVSTEPMGQTEFNIPIGKRNFHSTDYTYLVVSGGQAQYAGTGTIDGRGPYQFVVTLTDGEASGGGPDRFRIKITDAASNVVYDNVPGAPDGLGTGQPIEQGTIIVHR